MRTFLLLAAGLALLVAGCSESVPAALGESCGAERGCEEGLTCRQGSCALAEGEGLDAGEAERPGAQVPQMLDASGLGLDSGSGAEVGDLEDAAAGPSDAATPSPDAGAAEAGEGPDADTVGPDAGCGRCEAPPDDCHAKVGRCQDGRCVYDFVEGAACDDRDPCTVDDTCTAGTCLGTPMPCLTPPSPTCLSATQLRTHDQQGTCSGGLCVYAKKTITCSSGGCQSGACQTDPCASISCNQPPSSCYGSSGTCSGGSCSYPFADGTSCNDNNACTESDECNAGLCQGAPKACTTLDSDSCADASTAKIYDRVGTCSAGTCSYNVHFVTCAAGCANGRCNGSGWTAMQSNALANLYAVWGSSATSVWAVGEGGAALYYDGIRWQAKPSGAGRLLSIHGTAENNVFAASRDQVLRFDGTDWKEVFHLSPYAYADAMCVFAYANDDVFAYTTDGRLMRVKDGASTRLGSRGQSGLTTDKCGVWAFSPTNVWVSGQIASFDGSAFNDAGSPWGNGLWAADAQHLFTFSESGANVSRWNGSSWQLLNTGMSGYIRGLAGSAPNRVFAVGTRPGNVEGWVTYWDGSGWAAQQIPSETPRLNGVWVAPTGEVFAVGDTGTILKGP